MRPWATRPQGHVILVYSRGLSEHVARFEKNTKQHVLQVDCRHFSAPGMTFGRMTSHIGLAHRLSGESRIACREVKREITFYVCQGWYHDHAWLMPNSDVCTPAPAKEKDDQAESTGLTGFQIIAAVDREMILLTSSNTRISKETVSSSLSDNFKKQRLKVNAFSEKVTARNQFSDKFRFTNWPLKVEGNNMRLETFQIWFKVKNHGIELGVDLDKLELGHCPPTYSQLPNKFLAAR